MSKRMQRRVGGQRCPASGRADQRPRRSGRMTSIALTGSGCGSGARAATARRRRAAGRAGRPPGRARRPRGRRASPARASGSTVGESRPGSEVDDRVQRVVGRVQHQVAAAAGVDDAVGSPSRARRRRGAGASSRSGRATSTASDSSTVAIGRRPFWRSVSPLETRSHDGRRPRPAAAPARPSRGWRRSRPRRPSAAKKSSAVMRGCDVATRPPSSSATVVDRPPGRHRHLQRAAAEAERHELVHARRRTRAIWSRPATAASTAPSAVQAGMSSARAKSTSMSHWEQCAWSARPLTSTSTPAAARPRSSAGCVQAALATAAPGGSGRLIAASCAAAVEHEPVAALAVAQPVRDPGDGRGRAVHALRATSA